MRGLSGVLLAGAILVMPALSQTNGVAWAQTTETPAQGTEAQAAAPAPKKFTFEGEIALWSVGVKADKTADFEQVMLKLKEALAKSENPQAKQQAAGWKVMKGVTNPTNGDIIYTHVIYPVVPGADYAVMQNIYEVFKDPAERRRIYELYRGAFSQNLAVNTGTVVIDMGKP